MIRAAVVTVSDRSYRQERADASGPAVEEVLSRIPVEVVRRIVVPDEKPVIRRTLRLLSDSLGVDLIVTTGGTGVDPRDVTPEATREEVEREVPGMAEFMRSESQKKVATAMLSRAVVGIRGRTLIVNLPGSPGGARENLESILSVIPHAVEKIRGGGGDCAI